MAQATVRPLLIVLTTPGLEDDRRLTAVREEFRVQALVPEAAVEALPVRVLPRAARVDVPAVALGQVPQPLTEGLVPVRAWAVS
jgi:hypothetical protein